ncbi:hypothetical protein ACI2LF_09195 [Kribbella sp. NPDC020789]
MHVPVAIGTTALLLTAGLSTAAWAAAPEVPTDLQIGWADPAAPAKVRLTWKDNGEANQLRVEYQGSSVPRHLVQVPADQPNDIARTAAAYFAPNRVARIQLTAVGADGVESAPVFSPWFDTSGPAAPTLTGATPRPDGSLEVSWVNAAAAEDTTPGDPLDLPTDKTVGPVIWSPRESAGGTMEWFAAPAGTTTAVVPARPRPFPVRVAAQNEWGRQESKRRLVFSTMSIRYTFVPTTDEYSWSEPIQAAVSTPVCLPMTPGCKPRTTGIPVTLEGRANAKQPWSYISRAATGSNGLVQVGTRARGGQEYRLNVPSWKNFPEQSEWIVATAASTSARLVKTRAYIATAGFSRSTAQVGQTVNLVADSRPWVTTKVTLQAWNGKTWRTARTVQLTNGKATVAIRAAGRGTKTRYRIAVPRLTVSGLPIEPTVSREFTLTVR